MLKVKVVFWPIRYIRSYRTPSLTSHIIRVGV